MYPRKWLVAVIAILCSSAALGQATTNFLREDGTWAAPIQYYQCTGNDTAGLNAAIASGASYVIINGTCTVTSLNQLPTNFTLRGNNPTHDIIQTTSPSVNMITLNAGDMITDLTLSSSVTPTGGSLLFCNLGGNAQAQIAHVIFNNPFVGFDIDGCNFIHGTDLIVTGSSHMSAGIQLRGSSGVSQPFNADVVFSQVLITSGTPFCSNRAGNGVNLIAVGDVEFSRLQVICAYNGIAFIPSGASSSGNIVEFFSCSQCIFDTNANDGIVISPTSGADVLDVFFSNTWSSSNVATGLDINGVTSPASVNGVSVVNSIFGGNNYGIALTDNCNCFQLKVENSIIAGNTHTGFYDGVNDQAWSLVNNKIGSGGIFGGNGIGLECGGTGQTQAETIVTENDISGNTTNASCPNTFSVKANNINF